MDERGFVVDSMLRSPKKNGLWLLMRFPRGGTATFPAFTTGDDVELLTVDGEVVRTRIMEYNPVFIDPIDLPYITFGMFVPLDAREKSRLVGARVRPARGV